jgi:two-component system, OmpR family, sensor histidine kinase TctE
VNVRGNALLLREMIANLVDNAIAHAPQGGAVAVRVSPGLGATVEVEDNGPGIAPAEREKVFERFYRAPGAAAGGSGLGLAIVRNIGLAHRARIDLTTPASGVGLCVRVQFERPT